MAKKQYPLNAKNLFGLSTMRWTVIAGSSLMTTAFMMYLTDYSGLANAAAIATILLTVGRIFDAVDDPLQGWIMDRSAPTKIGKFKPFLLGGIMLTTVAIIMLFNLPAGMPEWFKIVFLFIGYFMYEIGVSFQPDIAIKATMTNNPTIREKLLVVPRIVEQFAAIPFSFFMTLALVMGQNFGGDIHKGFGVTTVAFMLPMAAIALLGAFCIKEGPHGSQNSEKIGIKDILQMFKTNKPLLVSQVSGIIGGCSFTFLLAAVSYYIKWAYGPENFATNSALFGMTILFGIVLGTVVAPPLLKKFTPAQGSAVCNFAQALPLAIIFVLNFFGIPNIVLFFALLFISLVFSGMNYIPGSMLNMECMDYNIWKTGNGMEGMVQAVGSFVGKAQVAIAGLATGAVLVAINYDAALYESEAFIAAGNTIPPELITNLTIVFCLIPVVLGVVSGLIIMKYPLKKDERNKMYQELEKRGSDK